MLFNLVTLFIFGLCIGSFINALVYRLEEKKRIVFDRSECPHCFHKLSWRDLMPLISFGLLQGHCRYCKRSISWQYPLVELLTGIAFILPFATGSAFDFFYLKHLVFATILIIIFAYDLRYMLIPDFISIPAIIIVFVIQAISYKLQAISYIFAALLASCFFLVQFIISKGRWIGGGDIRLGFLMGLMVGWPNIISALFLSYIAGSLITLPLVASRKYTMKSAVPFGVFLTIAAIVVMVWGEWLIGWYMRLIT